VPRLRRPRSIAVALRLAASGLLAAVAVVLAVRPSAGPARAAPGPATVTLTVAARDLPPGTAVTTSDLRAVGYPRALVPDGATADLARLTGRVLAAGVRKGEPITDARLVGAGLTSLLEPGQVGAPIRPADLAVTELVRAGDRVDVLATPEGATEAQLVTARALVLAASSPRSGAGPNATGDAAGLLLLAVDGPTAARLAAASAGATLTVALTTP
jgi:pilus assembly protein CpaB